MSNSSGDQLSVLQRPAGLTGTPATSPIMPLPSWLRAKARQLPDKWSVCANAGTADADTMRQKKSSHRIIYYLRGPRGSTVRSPPAAYAKHPNGKSPQRAWELPQFRAEILITRERTPDP